LWFRKSSTEPAHPGIKEAAETKYPPGSSNGKCHNSQARVNPTELIEAESIKLEAALTLEEVQINHEKRLCCDNTRLKPKS